MLSLNLGNTTPSPFLKWAGGKSSLIKQLLPHVPQNLSNYYEPFLGGGALFFATYERCHDFKAQLSDVNPELINLYKIIKDEPADLIELVSTFQEEYYQTPSRSEYYYGKRESRPRNRVESAARLLFLNRTCYNGLYRVNSRGMFNVPFGRYANPRILDEENILAASKALRETNSEIRCSDYRSAISDCENGDFVYLDPPYQPKSKTSSFTGYTPGGFSEQDQEELAEEFKKLVDRGCTLLMSNSETPLTASLYAQYCHRSVTVNRPINSVGSGRRGYKELIVLGNPR